MPRPLILVAACLVAALAAGIAGSLALTAISLVTGGMAQGVDLVGGLIVSTIILCLFGLVAVVVFGLPMHAVLMRWGRRSPLAYGLTGGAIGVLLQAALTVPVAVRIDPAGYLLLAFGLAAGAAGASAFWWILRPDRRPVRSLPGE